MNENKLTDAFEDILPEQPSTKGWAGVARRRRKQQRGIAAAAVVAVVVAIAIPLGLSLGDEPQVMATPSPTVTQQPEFEETTPEFGGCLTDFVDGFPKSDLEGGKIPEGATKLWLCGGGFEGPQEALTTEVDAAVQAFNDLTFVEGVAIDCASNGEAYTLLFEYPNGETESAEGFFTPNGCQHFNTSYGIIEGADTYLESLQGLWETQRASQTPVGSDGGSCPGLSSVFRIDFPELEGGSGCVVRRTETEGTNNINASVDVLPRDLLTLILEDLPAGSEPLEGDEPYSSDQQIILRTEHGDPIALNWGEWGDGLGFAWNNPEGAVWYPDEALQARVKEYFGQLGSGEDPAPTPQEVNECALDAEGQSAATDLPNNVMPDGPAAVWMCTGIESTALAEPLVGAEDTQQVVDEFNRLPEVPYTGSETAPSLIDSHLVVTYPGGERYVIKADFYDSFVVRWGVQEDRARFGSLEWVRGLKDLWVQQRDANPQQRPLEPSVGVCEDALPGLGRGIEKYDVDGALCHLVQPSGGNVKGVEIPAPPEVFERVRDEALNTRGSLADGRDVTRDWNGDSIILVDDYGDRLSLLRIAENTWVWEEGGETYEFTPSAELTEQLERAFALVGPS